MTAAIAIRAEAPADAEAIAAVTREAFASVPHSDHSEHRIIAALRADGALAVSLVAEHDRRIVGHAAASAVSIGDGTAGWYGLGPLAVAPSLQRQGIGATLVHAVLERLQAEGARGCVVLGEPSYYWRFGFAHDARLAYPGVPAEYAAYFMAVHWRGASPQGDVTYHPAFDAGG